MTGPLVMHCAETIKGGIATYLRDLIPLQIRDFGAGSVIIVAPHDQVNELGSCAESATVKVFRAGRGRLFNSIKLLFVSFFLCAKHKPDIVHLHSSFAGVAIRPIFKIFFPSVKIVYCPHGWAFSRNLSCFWKRFYIQVERILARFTDAIICVSNSEYQLAIASRVGPGRVCLVVNGISQEIPGFDSCRQPNWREGRKKLLFVGRFDYQKGIDVLVSVLRRLGDTVHANIIGGSVVDGFDNSVFPDNSTVVGWLSPSDLSAYFLTADFLVVPSRWEGLPLVVLEAMRAGLPVIASDIPPHQEIISDLENGVLFQEGNVGQLVEIVNEIKSEDLCSISQRAKSRFDKCFTIERVHSELLRIYKSV